MKYKRCHVASRLRYVGAGDECRNGRDGNAGSGRLSKSKGCGHKSHHICPRKQLLEGLSDTIISPDYPD